MQFPVDQASRDMRGVVHTTSLFVALFRLMLSAEGRGQMSKSSFFVLSLTDMGLNAAASQIFAKMTLKG